VNRRFLNLYENELSHLRSHAAEFAREFPGVAHALALDTTPCPDPYVERLLEGFAFLSARVQEQIEAGYPRVVQSLLEAIYPNYLAPTPSMAMLRFLPDTSVQELRKGLVIPRDTAVRWQTPKMPGQAESGPRAGPAVDLHRVIFRTAHDVTLYPIHLVEAGYYARDMAALKLGAIADGASAALMLRLSVSTDDALWNQIEIDRLPIHIGGIGPNEMRLFEHLLARCVRVIGRPREPIPGVVGHVDLAPPSRQGFAAAEALLPCGPRSFHGYRLIQEYFALPQRFMNIVFSGLRPLVSNCRQREIEIIALFDSADPVLEKWQQGDPRNIFKSLELFASPAINLFRRKADGIIITEYAPEHHLVVDRGAPIDYEVFGVEAVSGYDTRSAFETSFHPFHSAKHTDAAQRAYFSVSRAPRGVSASEAKAGRRSSYAGSEVFISLVDATCAPLPAAINRLDVDVLCTNRDLPRFIQPDPARPTDFAPELAGVRAIKLVSRPSDPTRSPVHGNTLWKLVNHLSVNYLTILDASAEMGASAIRDLLRLYAHADEDSRDAGDSRLWISKQIDGLRSIERAPLTTRLDVPGPITFARGIELNVEFDDLNFEGSSPFLLGAVLEQFFARYASINSFTQTVVRTRDRRELIRWPATLGNRPVL
jgi:type VI secretion system protein ImpG